MLGLHAALGVVLLVVTLALVVYAWLARGSDAPPLGMRLLFMVVSLLIFVQFGAGTGLLAQGHHIIGSHHGTAILAVPLLALPAVTRDHKPLIWITASVGLFLVMLGTAVIGWNR